MNNEKLNYIPADFWKAVRSENWERVGNLITLNPEFMALGLECAYKHLPDEYKFSIPVECYTHNGDSMPTVRKYVRSARKYAPLEKRIPAEFITQSEIIVYRAGEENIDRARCAISWTTDFGGAKFMIGQKRLGCQNATCNGLKSNQKRLSGSLMIAVKKRSCNTTL